MSAPALRVLSVAGSKYLHAVTLKLPALASLNANKCVSLASVDLSGCAQLSTLLLSHCKALDALRAPDSARLAQCSLFGCRALAAAHVQELLAVCGAALASLDLNGAIATEGLSEKRIGELCSKLEHLDIRGRARKH